MNSLEALENIPQRYKDVVDFMEGVQSMELFDEEKKIDIRKTTTENHWVYHFILPPKLENDKSWRSFRENNISTFGIYFHMFKDEIVVKASVLTGGSTSEKNMLNNNLNDEIRKLGFRHISFDPKIKWDAYKPQTFVKILFYKEKTLEDMHKLYELIKEYNLNLRDEWLSAARSHWR